MHVCTKLESVCENHRLLSDCLTAMQLLGVVVNGFLSVSRDTKSYLIASEEELNTGFENICEVCGFKSLKY